MTGLSSKKLLPNNAEIAELLASEAERREGILQRAFKRAARSAFLWPEEASALLAENRSSFALRR